MAKNSFSFEEAFEPATFSFEDALGSPKTTRSARDSADKIAWESGGREQFKIDDYTRKSGRTPKAYEQQTEEQDIYDPVSGVRMSSGEMPIQGAKSDKEIDRLNAIERKADELALTNTQKSATRERLVALATDMVDRQKKPAQETDRVQEYLKNSNRDLYSSDDEQLQAAKLNAGFDISQQGIINKRTREAAPDEATGKRIGQSYNPNQERDRVKAEISDMEITRDNLAEQYAAGEMNSTARGLLKGAVQSAGLTGAAGAYLGDVFGSESLKAKGLEFNDRMSRTANNLTLAKEFTNIGSVDDFQTWLAENSGYVAYQAAEALLSAGVGSVVGKSVGKEALVQAGLMGANNLRQTLGSVYADAVEESKLTGKPMPPLWQIAAGAAASAAVDTVADKLGLDSITAKGFKGNVASRMTKSIGSQMAVQGGTEAAQLIPEDLGAGKDPFRAGAADRFINEGAVGALGGGGPGIIGGVKRQLSEREQAEADIASAIDGTSFTQSGVDRDVANTLRTEPITSRSITPEATVTSFADPNGPASQAGITPIVVPNVSTPSNTGGLAAGATVSGGVDPIASVGDTGQVDVVNGSVGGVAAGAMAPNGTGQPVSQDAQPTTDVNPIKRNTDSSLLSRVPVEQDAEQPAQSPEVSSPKLGDTPSTIWTGRSGAGYDTIESAQQAMQSRTAKDPELDWKVEQRADGKYHLAGYTKAEAPLTKEAAQQQVTAGTEAADLADFGAEGYAVAPARTKETVSELRKQQPAIDRLTSAIATTGEDASGIQAAPATNSDSPALAGAKRIVGYLAAVSKSAFGIDVVPVKGIGGLGVAHEGTAFANVDEIAAGGKNSVAALAIGAIGHEVGHVGLERSKDPEDLKAYSDLKTAMRAYYKAGVVDKQQDSENAAAQAAGAKPVTRDYAENEVIQNINGAMWLDNKFWGRLYDLDPNSMRRVAYRFMQAATKMIKAAKGTDLDIDTLVNNVDAVREIVAKTWAEKAMRSGKPPMSRTQINQMIDTLPSANDPAFKRRDEPQTNEKQSGVYGEVAPDPRNATAKANWDELTTTDKLGVTKEVMDGIFAKVASEMGLKGWSIEYTTGMYEGGVNPSGFIKAPAGTSAAELSEVGRVMGYILDQKGMVAFDESNTTSGTQAAFVKVILPAGMEASRIDEIRQAVFRAVPQAEGDTLRDGSLVFGNFSQFNEKGFVQLSDDEFADAIEVALKNEPEAIEVTNPREFHSEWIQPSWDTEYSPTARDGFLEGTRYASNTQGLEAGGDNLRGATGGNVSRAWLQQLALSTDRKISKAVDYYRANPTKRSGAGVYEATAGAEREYGTATQGAVARVGVHFSQQRRANLSSQYHGRGLQGAERDRMAMPGAIKDRLYFYVDKGTGVVPEAGVGGVKHTIKLNNLYDINKDVNGYTKLASNPDPMKYRNNWERMVRDAGFDGYAIDNGGNQAFAILLGKHDIEMPAFKRRSSDDLGNDIDNIDDLGAFNLDADYANSTEEDFDPASLKSEDSANMTPDERLRAEMADAEQFRRELEAELRAEGFGVAGTVKAASVKEKSFADVKPADIKAAGFMPETAYPDLTYYDSANGLEKNAYFVVGGQRYRATISNHNGPDLDLNAITRNKKGSTRGIPLRYQLGGLSDEAREAWNKRFAASADLFGRGFDLYTSVPKAARDNILATWKKIAENPDAFEFAKATNPKGKNYKEVAQDIADQMLKGSRYAMTITETNDPVAGSGSFGFTIKDTKSGVESTGDIEFHPQDKEVTVHVSELEKGSGTGKPVYQVAQAFATAFKSKIEADPQGLLGVNNYRRTEQMFSGALRSGNFDTMQPGVGQRIYGWNERAKTQEQQDRNFVRMALAATRNALEFAPTIKDFGYDIATDKFYLKGKERTFENDMVAGNRIKMLLQNKDARVASISRSTLARAAITLQAIDGQVDVPESIANPVLYKRKEVPKNAKLERWAEDLMAGRRADPGFVVADEPHKALQMFGVGSSAPVALQDDMIRHLNNKGRSNNGITASDIAKIPALLDEPRAVIERVSTDKKTGLTKREYAMILDDENEDGSPMLIALTPAQLKMGQKSVSITDIRSMYGKDDSLRYVLQSIVDGQRIWMPEKEIARVRDFTGEGLIPYGTNGAAPPQTQKGTLTKQVSQAIPSNVFGQKALVKSGQGGKDWQLLKEAVNVTPDDVKRAGSIAFKRKQTAAQGLPEETRMQAFQRVMQDQYNRLNLVQELLVENGGTVGEEQNVYQAEERMHGRVHELLRQFADDAVHPMLKKAVKYKIDLDELALYAYAKHAKERNAHIQGINKQVQTGSGMSDVEADNIIQLVELSADKDKFEELHQDLMGMTATTRRVLVDEGLITQDEYDGLEKQYENYVPLRGFADQDEKDGKVRPGLGRGFTIKGKETIKAMGRDSKAGDIIENIIRDYERATIRAERNAVGKTFLDLVTTNPDPKLWEVQPVKRATRMDGDQVRYQNVEDKGDDTISVKVAGQQVYVKINDPLLLRAMQNAFKSERSDAEHFIMKGAGMYTSLLRNTITRYNPVFGVINAMRDAQMGAAGVFDELGAEGLKLYSKHYAFAMAAGLRTERGKSNPQAKKMDKWMEEMRFAGGTTGGVFMRDNETIQSELRDAMLAAGASPKGVLDWAKHNTGTRAGKRVLHALEIIGATSEHAARLAAYVSAREMGKTPGEAASIAKNLTVNFNRFGEQGQFINTLFLFYNASVQGSVRIAQMMKNPKIRYAMAGAASVGLGLAMMAASVGGDDEDGQPYWDKIPDWEKERNLIVMLPPGSDMGESVGTNGRYLKIPMAYGLNIFPVLGYQIADLIRNAQDPAKGVGATKAGINMLSAVMGSYNPMGGSLNPTDPIQLGLAVAPTIADPFIQLAAGVDGFGKPTGPSKSPYDQRPDSETVSAQQHGSVYHRISRWVNEASGGNQVRSGAIDIQPGTIKNLGGIVGGGLGKFVGDVINLGYLGATDSPISQRDIPVVKQLYGEYDKKAGMSLYYDRSKKALDEYKDIKEELKGGIKQNYTDEQKFLYAMGDSAKYIGEAMGELKKYEIQISESSMTSKEKDLARRELQKAREKYAESFNRIWYEKESELLRKK